MFEIQQTKKRPRGLTILCVLTLIGSLLGGFIAFFLIIINVSYVLVPVLGLLPKFTHPYIVTAPHKEHFYFFLSKLIVGIPGDIFCFVGALEMFILKKIGFKIYVTGVLISLILTFLKLHDNPLLYVVGPLSFVFSCIMAIVFIFLYWRHLGALK